MILLDTDILIEIERGNESVSSLLASLRGTHPDVVGLSSCVYAELLFGYIQSNKTVPPDIELLDVIEFDKESATIFAQKKKELEQRGTPIPIFDLITASCAISRKATLVTCDKHFQNVSDLSVVFFKR